MNYIQLINSFWKRVTDHPIKTSSTALYFALADMNNRFAWAKKFVPDYGELIQKVNISKNTYYECLKELAEQGYINYEVSNNRTLTGKVSIVFVSQFLVHEQEPNHDSSKDSKDDSTSTLNKPINPKTLKTKKQEFVPPSLDQVKSYFIENGKSEEVAIKAWNHYHVANWIDTHGNPVKSWKQKMLTNWFDEKKFNKQNNMRIAARQPVSKAETIISQHERLTRLFNEEANRPTGTDDLQTF